jgi:hypothetical protein
MKRIPNLSYLIILGAAAPGALALYYVLNFTVNVPHFDEWRTVPTVVSWASDNWSWNYLFRQYDGQRVPLQQAIAVLSTSLTGWNIRFEIMAGFAMLAATGVLLTVHAGTIGLLSQPRIAAAALIPSMLVLFSLRQWENLLEPWDIYFFGSTFFVLLTIYVLTKAVHAWVVLIGVISAILASATFLNGLLSWPLGAVVLWLSAPANRRAKYVSVWLACAAVFLSVYFYGFRAPEKSNAILDIKTVVGRGLAILGNNLMNDKGVLTAGGAGRIFVTVDGAQAIMLGIFTLSAALTSLWYAAQNHIRDHVFAIATLAYGSLTTGMIAAGRAELGLEQALSSRYTTISGIVIIATIFIFAEAKLLSSSRSNWIQISLVALVISSSSFSTATELFMGPHRKALFLNWADKVRNYRSLPDDALKNPHFTPTEIRNWASSLEQHKLSVFKGN